MEPKNPFFTFIVLILRFFKKFTSSLKYEKVNAGNISRIIKSGFKKLSMTVLTSAVLLVFSATLLSGSSLPAPGDGDYQTRATGNWNLNTTWQVRSGGVFVNCLAGDYPGAAAGAGTVTLLNGHVVTVTANVPNAIGALAFEDGTTLATTVILANRTLTVTEGVTFGAPAADAGDQSITITSGILNCASVFMPNTSDATYDVLISLTTGTLNVTGNILMNGTGDRNNISFTGGGALNAGGDFTGGDFAWATSTVTYNGTTQQIGSYTYYNLIINGGNTKTLAGSASVTNTLTLTSGVVRLGAYDLTITSANPVGGAPFSVTKMIETNGTGHFIRSGNLANQNFNLTCPVGSNGYYNPLVISGLGNIAAAARSLSVRAVPSNLGVLTNILNKYWDLSATNITVAAGTVLSFAYNSGEVIGDPSRIQLYTNTSGSWAKATGASAPASNPSTSTGSASISGSWTVGSPGTFYSYQTGNWNQATTWTFDPGGTTGPGSLIPGLADKVVILTGRTVSLSADVTSPNLDITINSGGMLDQSTFRFTTGLTALRGGGTLKLSSAFFPSPVTTNTFVTADGGTTEYNAAVTMPPAQSTYYHLSVKTAGTVIQGSSITLNGNLHVKQGTFQINDATAQRLSLIINGNVTVDNTGAITVGTGVTNSQTSPLGINGVTGAFINYYELQSHRVQVFGDFTNNGVVKFTNLQYPVYNSFPPIINGPTTGFATVYFNGSGDKTLTCNGQTDFYNLILDKGSDQTFKLAVYSSAYTNFRLFGANTSEGEVLAPATAANPNLKKALWIRSGTLVLQGLTVIPSLSEGATAGPPSSDFYLPLKAAVMLDGAGVIVMSTADDYKEVNGAYGVAAPDNAAMGINTVGDYCGLSLSGKLQVNDGYLSTRESGGIIYWSYAPGQFILNAGTVDSKQFHSSSLANSLISYTQAGGTFLLRGRFQRTTSIFTPAGLVSAPINNLRAANGIDAAAGSFSITNSGGANGFSMTGGTIRVYDVCGTTSPTFAFQVACSASDINVTGGTVEIIPTAGSVPVDDADYLINTTAPFGNLLINSTSGTKSGQLNTNPVAVLNNLTISSGVLTANNLDITIGGDFTIASGSTYTPGTNTTKLNGTGTQTFSLYAAQPLYNFTIDKPGGIAVNFAGTSGLVINGTGNFRLVNGTLNDNGNIINIAGSVYNSGLLAGTGKIVLNGASAQTVDGNGIFGNVDMNNTSATPVSLLANMTVNGILSFQQNRLFNIGTYNLKLNSSASIQNGGTLRYIQTAGTNGDGGLTKVFASPAAFIFHLGVAGYTPASIGFSTDPSVYGSVTVIPVNYAHPNVTVSGRSLSYYWRVLSSGFTLGPATVTHGYTYLDANVVTGGTVTENEYVAARFNSATSTWTKGTVNDVDETGNIIGEPGSGSFLENVAFIDGEYTAGDDNPTDPFSTPKTYYSRQAGLWSNVATWSLTSHTVDNPPAVVPGANDIVIIGGQDSVYLTTNNTVANTGSVSCATLQIEKGSALDVGYNPSSIFSRVITHPNGNGNFRVTTNFNSPSTYVFPSGDFSDYNVNMGTTELYTTNSASNTTYYLPANVSNYGNLILSPLGGSNVIFANRDITIYGNLITRGQNADSWFCPSWGTTYPGPVGTVAKTITVKGNMDIQGGALIWLNNGAIAQNFNIEGDVRVATLSALYVWGGATNQSMFIGGNLINNTDGLAHGLTTTSKVDFTNIPVTFNGSNNASITNTAGTPVTVFSTMTVDKGTSQATTLTINIAGTLTTPANNWLTLLNGTLRYMRSDPGTDFSVSTTTAFAIPASAGLYINLPSNSGNRNILIGNAANNSGDLLLNGKLTVISGNIYVGPVGAPANNNDIEYSSSGASMIEIQGGLLRVNGQIRRNPSNAGGILKYVQSGGILTINGQAFVNTNAKFEVVNNGSEFTMSAGTINIIRGNGATVTPSSPFGDVYIRPQTGSVTGGTIIFSQGALATQNYFLDATIPLNNITITGAAGQPAVVRLLTSPLTVNGNMLINANSVLNSNNINITFNGNFTNTPGAAGYIAGTNLSTFSASTGSSYTGAQSLTGITTFYDLLVNPGVSLTLNSSITANRNLTISSGNLICQGNTINVKGDLANNASYTDNNAVGNGIILNGAALQHISGSGAFARLTLNNAAGARTENDISLQEDLTMTLGILNIQKNLLTLSLNSNIQGAPFGTSKMILTDGVLGNGGLRKFFNTGPTASFLYPLGTSTKYTPATLDITANSTVGYVRINNVNSMHPGVTDPANALDFYWDLQSSGVTNLNGSLVLNYLQEDVIGAQENSYLAARLIVPGTTWVKTAGVDPALNKLTFNYTTSNNLSGNYTAGITTAFPNNVPEYTSNKNGNWTDNTIWDQTGGDPYPCPLGGPNGFIVTIDHEVTANFNNCNAYRTTINNKLKVVDPYFGHNFGTVLGSGTLYLENGSFPAGVFTTFLSCSNNSTVEYGGSGTYTILADLYDNIPKLHFTGTGTRVLPDKDLIICTQLLIDGPTLDNSVYNRKLIIKGTLERYNTGAFTSGTGTGATVSFAGTASQTVGGALGDFTGSNAFNNLEINNSSGLTINNGGAVEVTENLLLTNGLINTGPTGTLTISNSAINCVTPAGGSTSSFVNGPLIKKINQYENFLFPVGIRIAGPVNILGNKLKISSTQSGPTLWSAEYRNPNGTYASFTAPLIVVSAQEYWNIKVAAGNQSILNINWTPTSDITPLVAGSLSAMRLSKYDTGTSKWIELPTTSTGDNYNGTATSASLLSSTGSDDYTLASVSSLIPSAKLAPTGPVCGAAGIPVSFSSPAPAFDYILNYKVGGVAQPPVTITPAMIPYILPTPVPGVYVLTGFTCNSGSQTGTVDATSVTVYAAPTVSNAGIDRAICGITTTNLAANTPLVGSGLWTIVSGSGGTIITPTNPASQFIGLNGVVYTLRWTISNGSCQSSDDMIINFLIAPDPPTVSTPQNFCPGATIANLVATPPPACTVDWYAASTGGTPLAGSTVLVNNTTYYAESNGGCVSFTRTPVLVTVGDAVNPTITCSPDIARNIDPGVCTASVNVPNATIADNCSIELLTWSMAGATTASSPLTGINQVGTYTFNLGITTVSYILKDVAGNQANCSFIVTVTDNNLPVITLPVPPLLNADASCQATIPAIAATFSDNCTAAGSIITSQVPAAGTVVGLGITTVTITATDLGGNSASSNIDVTVVDATSPVITPPSGVTLNLDNSCKALIPDFIPTLVVSDNCTPAGAVIKTQNPVGGSAINGVVLTNVKIYATDASGNKDSVTVVVTTKDVTPPLVICRNINLYLDGTGSATLTGAAIDNGSTDNCSPLTLFVSKTNFGCADIGAPVSVTLTGTDLSGNSSTCNSLVTVLDTVGPTVNVKAFNLILGPGGTGTLLPSDVDNGSFDNCGTITLSVLPNTFSCVDQGTHTVTLTAVDSHLNARSKSVQITVSSSLSIDAMSLNSCDVAAPFALYQSTVTGGNGTYSYLWDVLETGAEPFIYFDAVFPFIHFASTSTEETPFFNNLMPDGTYHIRLVVTDGNGCTDTLQMVMVKGGITYNNVTLRYTNACEGEIKTYSVAYDATATYTWNVTNGTFLTPTNTNTVDVQWNLGAIQGVLVANSTKPDLLGNPCGSSVVDTVTINSSPVPAFNSPVLDVCSNSEITYTLTNTYSSYSWTVTGGVITAGGNAVSNFVTVRWGTGPAGKVTVVAENGFTCTGAVFIDINIFNLSGTITSQTNITCNGVSDGKVTALASAGTGQPPYEYSLDGSYQASGSFTGISLGNHTVRIRDLLMCTFDLPFTITQPPVLSASAVVTNVPCFGGTTGSVDLTVSGGTAPYTYLWSNGATTEDISGLAAGNYTVIITDFNSCTINTSWNVTQPALIVATAMNNGPVCEGTALNLTGGPAGMTIYSWTGPIGFLSLLQNPVVSPAATPAMAGNYTLTVTDAGGCTASANTNVTVTPTNTITLTSAPGTDNQTVCIGNAITTITYITTGANGANFTGLPAGMTVSWAANNVVISGLPTTSGVYNYTINLSGGCGTVSTTGTITVMPVNTITLTSAAGTDNQTVCVNAPLTGITYATTVATGATFSGLPAGVTGTWAANTVTISGTPTATGSFTYTITLTGGCGTVTKNGIITVSPNNTVTLTSPAGTISQTVCINTPITNITYSTTGATGATFSGLPAGVTGNWAAGVITISGTPTASGPFSYTATLTGGCGTVTANGTITVTPDNTMNLTSAAGTDNQTLCINTPIISITYSTTGATGTTVTGLPAGVTGSWAANAVTISGSPTVSGSFSYTVTLTGGCGTATANGTITVTPDNTVTLTSAAGTNNQAVCVNTVPITNITYSTTGATGATITGLPAGVTGTWAANVVTISGTPTASGSFNYTITLTGGCGTVTANGTITASADNTITLTSAPGTDNQTVCIGDAIITITYVTTGATGANFTGLPAGMTVSWAGNNVTISGLPTTSGIYNYTINLSGGCGTVSATGTITVMPVNKITLTSAAGTDNQTVCVNTPLTGITYTTTVATGATFSGLPAGVTGTWAAGAVTISGTPTATGTFSYTITLTGGCGVVTASGTITVAADNTIAITSAAGTDNQSLCINTPITNITYSTTGATGASFTGLPAGVTGNWAAGAVTISGTPTASGSFSYTVTLTGGCGTITANGSISVSPDNTIALTSAAGTDNQTLCINTALISITYGTTGATGATITGLPAGVTGSWASNAVTISGSPTASGSFSFAVTLTGGCGTITANGTITVTPDNTVTLTSSAGTNNQTVCINTPLNSITYGTTGATGATITGLPAGVTGAWAANIVTIIGTPTASGSFSYTVTLTGGCGAITTNGSITVSPDNTISLTSAAGTDNQTLCINTPLTTITYGTTGASGATITGLPAGVTGIWAANVVTISGTPTASGPFSYTVTLTGGCGTLTVNGNITVKPDNTITLISASGTDNQTVCINTPVTSITYSTTGATGATITGLPAGVTGNWAANVVTISGTPTASGPFSYTVTLTGGCGTLTANGNITVTADNTVTLTSAAGTDNQTVCIGSSVTSITYSTTSATGATITGLPAGVTGNWAADVITISGTPTATGSFSYSIALTGGCGTVISTGTITVSALNTISLSSAAGTDNQSLCINAPVINITYSTTVATGATFTGLPAGVTGSWAADIVTISGAPTASGTFNYTVTLTGGCGTNTVNGTLTVTPDNVITLTSVAGTDNQTLCINSPITDITYSTTGATGVTFTGFPAGVTGTWAANVVTISGTPTASGPFNYIVTLTGGCGTITANGTITVTPENTIILTSAPGTDIQTVCIGDAITTITYMTTGASGADFTGLPAGMTVAWAANLVTISGSPTTSGIYNYRIDLKGGCGTVSATGTITVMPANTITLTSAAGTDNQTACLVSTLIDIIYSTTGATGATITGLPSGITGSWTANVVTIAGSPTVQGSFNYLVTLTGGCGTTTANGTITVSPNNTIALSSAAGTDNQTVCVNTPVTNITYITTGATGASVTGLPAGVTGNWAADVVTISGTPTASGPFNFTVTLTGGCGTITANGTMTITPDNTIALTSAVGTDNQTVCVNTPVTSIIYSTTGATGATFAGLPAGVTGIWAADIVTINGTPTASGLAAYTITLTGGCGAVTTAGTLIVNDVPTGTTVVTDVLCNGAATGAIDLSVTGGILPYSFLWSNGAVTEDLVNIAAGTYTVTITDGNLCTGTASRIITEPATPLSGAITTQTDVTVYGGNDGSVTVDGSGGITPYLYKLDAGTYQVSGTFSSLTAATYTVTVQDANFCTFDVPVTITQPLMPLSGTIVSQTDVLCFGGATGSVTVTGVDGLAPYEYSLDGGAYQSSGTFTTLVAGSHTVTVRDALASTSDVPVTIAQPAAPLTVTTIQVNVLCAGGSSGSATATGADGTAPYSYSWSTTPVQTGATASGLKAGTYTVTVTDANGCTANTSVTIAEPLALTVITTQTNALCNDGATGTATAVPAGGTGPYAYSWNTSPVQTGVTATGLAAGSYIVTVSDANGCLATGNVTITEPAPLELDATPAEAKCPDSNDGSITLGITGGTPLYSFIWNDGITTQNRTAVLPGAYRVDVTDANGCQASTNTDVGIIGSFDCLVFPDIITPDPADGHNDEWIIRNIDIYPDAEVRIFTRWGKMIFKTKNISANPWNGRYSNGRLVPTDSYHYILYLNDGSEPRSGVISVIR